MEEKIINIATLTIDTQRASDAIVETKLNIVELQKANTELRKNIQSGNGDVKEQTRAFIENEQRIKALQAAYRQQSNALNEYTLEELKNTKALKDSAKSVDEAKEQNKELLKIRNQVNATTDDGRKAIELLNKKMEENTAFTLSNSTAQEKQKDNIGNYGSALDNAQSILEKFGVNVGGVRNVVQGFSSYINKASDDVTGFANSAIQSTKATLGFKTSTQLAAESQVAQSAASETQIAANAGLRTSQNAVTASTAASATGFNLLKVAIVSTGIGALVIGIVALVTALRSSEESSNKFAKSLSVFKGITSVVLKTLKPLGDFLIDVIGAAFEKVGELAQGALDLVAKGLKYIGFDGAAKSVSNFSNSIKTATDNAKKLADAEAKYKDASRESQKVQLDYQRQAERLRQLRDDESRSIADRIKSNSQLGQILKNQLNDELAIANQALNIAKLRKEADGESSENKDELAEAETRIADIRERISGQESEQLQNLNSLRKEAANKEKERKTKALQDSLISFELQKTTAEEQLAFYTSYYEKLNALEGNTNRVKNASDFSLKILDITKNQIDAELEEQKKRIDENKKLNEEERDDLIGNANFLRDEEIKRIKNSKLSARDKAVALEEIEKGYQENIAIIENNYAAAKKEREEIALRERETLKDVENELRLLRIEAEGFAELETQQLILDAQLEQKKKALDDELLLNKKTAEEVRALKELEDKKYAAATKKIDDQVKATKLKAAIEIAQKAVASAQLIFGESKALAVAAALINTFEGITSSLKAPTLGEKIAGVAFASATGFAAVKNILKTDKGSGGGSSGTVSGVSTPGEVFENPARTQTVARLQNAPPQDNNNQTQTVLVLETLDEVKNQQQIKIRSN
jgi:hypothetical protein